MEKKRILYTGSAGHAGSGIVDVLRSRYWIRGFDVSSSGQPHEALVGSVTDPDLCRQAVKGMDAVVIGHMAPRPDSYEPPFAGIDINVRGVANLYAACVEEDVRRVVLISSASIFGAESDPSAPPGSCQYGPGRDLYPVTKIMQETLAHHYFEKYGILTQALRPSWIVYACDGKTKRGVQQIYEEGLIDPADLAEAVHACLLRTPDGLEGYTVGQPEYPGVAETMKRLSWSPQYLFKELHRETVPS